MTWLIIGIIAWLACGFVASGFLYAYAQREFWRIASKHRAEDRAYAVGMGVMYGPIALVVSLMMTGAGVTHGWLAPWRTP